MLTSNVAKSIGMLLFALASCKSRTTSELRVDDGYFVLEAKSAMPATLSIISDERECVGNAVSDSTLITAAHCVTNCNVIENQPKQDCAQEKTKAQKARPVCATFLDGRKVCTDMVYLATRFLDIENYPNDRQERFKYKRKIRDNDVAVAVFPQGTFKYFNHLATNLVVPAKAFIVGYSEEFLYGYEFPKRWGRLDIFLTNSFENRETYNIQSRKLMDDASTSAISPGDSGGPLLNQECEEIGVSSLMFPASGDAKTSMFINLNNPENAAFLQEVATHGAKYCNKQDQSCLGEGYVRSVETKDSKEFPCRASAEASDPVIAEFFARIARERAQASKEIRQLVSCFDQQAMARSYSSNPQCVKGYLVQRNNQDQDCDAHYIDSNGQPLVTAADMKQVDGAESTTFRPKDLAFEQPESWRNNEALLNLSCKSESTGRCCMKPYCHKLQKIAHTGNIEIADTQSCPDSVYSAPDKEIPNYLLDAPITPPVERLRAMPFPCFSKPGLLLRKQGGICYEIDYEKRQSNQPVPLTCYEVKDARRTNNKLDCPTDLRNQLD